MYFYYISRLLIFAIKVHVLWTFFKFNEHELLVSDIVFHLQGYQVIIFYWLASYSDKLHQYYLIRVLDNLKDYAVQALVNAVDHLGTVAYKLTDLLEQQTLDTSTMELKVSCLNQVLGLHVSQPICRSRKSSIIAGMKLPTFLILETLYMRNIH